MPRISDEQFYAELQQAIQPNNGKLSTQTIDTLITKAKERREKKGK